MMMICFQIDEAVFPLAIKMLMIACASYTHQKREYQAAEPVMLFPICYVRQFINRLDTFRKATIPLLGMKHHSTDAQ
jgi:hypothetical protein